MGMSVAVPAYIGLREDLRRRCALYRDERNELACEPMQGGGS
jgi:hypothetical protein